MYGLSDVFVIFILLVMWVYSLFYMPTLYKPNLRHIKKVVQRRTATADL